MPNYTGDIKFLNRCPNLIELRMSSCFVDRDLADVSAFPDMFQMRKFIMRDVGLIRTTDLHFKMPLLELLDLQDNRIYEVEAVDDLSNFTSLVEVDLSSNPLNIHNNLQQMIIDANPLLEVVNKRQVNDIGHREQEGIRKLRREIIEYDQPEVGTTLGDRILAQADEEMRVDDYRQRLARIDEEKTQDNLEEQIKKTKMKNDLLLKVDEALQKQNEAAIENFERNQHMRLKFLCPDADQS